MKSYSVTIQMNATEQYFPVVLLIMLHKLILTFKSVDKILKCDHSIDHFTVVCLVTLPLSESEAGGDLGVIQTFLPFIC